MNTYYPSEPININIQPLMNIIQDNNRVITTKNGKGKLPLFCGNREQVIPIYARKESDNNPGYVVSVDQLQSSHPVLVSQFSCKLTSACIWSAQVMMDHFNELTYLHLMRSTNQEDTL